MIVTPNQVGIAATQTFSMAVPSEKDGLTITAFRLLIPAGLQQISPIIQTDWKIALKKDSKDTVSEIDMSGNALAFNQLANLSFRAQAPATTD